jgi:hypothetical protein
MPQEVQRAQTLGGRLVGLSAGDAQDIRAYGLLPRHLDLAFTAVVTALMLRGARLAYGGDLRQRGFTQQLYESAAEAYADDYLLGRRASAPFVHYLAASIWSGLAAEKLQAWLEGGSGLVEVRFMTGDGYVAVTAAETGFLLEKVPGADRTVTKVKDAREVLQHLEQAKPADISPVPNLRQMRIRMGSECDARILFGGKMFDYQGDEPGIGAEARESLAQGAIVLPLGGFGGAARDVAQKMGLWPDAPRRKAAPPVGPGYDKVMGEIEGQRARVREQLSDGIEPARRLAATTDIREAARLVVEILEKLPKRSRQ